MKKIVILGAPWCSACKQAKDYAISKGAEIEYHDLDTVELTDKTKALRNEALIERKVQSLPQIWSEQTDGERTYLGGLDAMIETLKAA